MKKIFVFLFCSLLVLGSMFSIAEARTALAPSEVDYSDLQRQLNALQDQINAFQWGQATGMSTTNTSGGSTGSSGAGVSPNYWVPKITSNDAVSGVLGDDTSVSNLISILSPNGGETWNGEGPVKTITWSQSSSLSLSNRAVQILSLLKGNSTVCSIARISGNVKSYSFNLESLCPNLLSGSDYRVRVELFDDGIDTEDTSNGVFSLSSDTSPLNPPSSSNPASSSKIETPKLLFSDISKNQVKISWNRVGNANKYIVTKITNDSTVYEGSAQSFVDRNLSCNTLLKYTIQAFGANNTSSNESSIYSVKTLSCTIADPVQKSLTLIAPDDFSYKAGSGANVYIKWMSSGITGTLTANLYKGSTLLRPIGTTLPTDQKSYNWTLPNDLSTGDYRIELKDNITGIKSSGDEGLFKIIPSDPLPTPKITVLSPKGGEVYKVGSVVTVKWEAKNLSTKVNNSFSVGFKRIENGKVVEESGVISVKNNSEYKWTIPSSMKLGLYKVKVFPDCAVYGNNPAQECSVSGESDKTFEIIANTYTGKPVSVTTPKGGEKWEIGKKYNIVWNKGSFKQDADVQIRLVNVRANTEVVIADTKNKGSYSWTVPLTLNTMSLAETSDPIYKVLVYIGNSEVHDSAMSTKEFSIIDARVKNIKVSLSKDTPKSRNVKLGETNTDFLKFDVKNSGKEDIVITGIKLNGTFDSTNVQNISVYDGTTLVGGRMVASNISGLELTITPTVTVGVGSSKVLTVKADIGIDVGSVKQKINIGVEKLNFKIGEKNFEVTSNVKGNKMTIVNSETSSDTGNVIVFEEKNKFDILKPLDNSNRWYVDENNFLKQFYQDYGDDYDFIVLLPTKALRSNYSQVMNRNIKGIGSWDMTNSETKKLSALTVVDFYPTWEVDKSFKDFLLEQVIIHEIGHYWLSYIKGFPDNGDGFHWAYNLDLFNGDSRYVDLMGYYQWFIKDTKEICVSNALGSSTPKFSNLSLYLMGFIPSSQVSPVSALEFEKKTGDEHYNMWGPNCNEAHKFTGTKTVTIQDIININGERIPSYGESQKNFRVAFVILTDKGTSVPTDFVGYVRKYADALPKTWGQLTNGKSQMSIVRPLKKSSIKDGNTTPSIKIISPNGGETFKMEDIMHIQWNINNASSFNDSMIELMVGDTLVCTLAKPTMKNGSNVYDWKVSSSNCSYVGPGPGYKMRVSFMNGSSALSDTSDISFSIAPSVNAPTLKVLSPNGGEKFEREKTMDIKWNASNYTGNVTLTLVDANRYPVMEIKSGIPASGGSYTWTIPKAGIYETNYRILIQGGLVQNYQAPLDYSDNTFFISVPTTTSGALAKPTNLIFLGYEMSGTIAVSKFEYTDNAVGETGYYMYWDDGMKGSIGPSVPDTGKKNIYIGRNFDCTKLPKSVYIKAYKDVDLSEQSNTVSLSIPPVCPSSSIQGNMNSNLLGTVQTQLEELKQMLLKLR